MSLLTNKLSILSVEQLFCLLRLVRLVGIAVHQNFAVPNTNVQLRQAVSKEKQKVACLSTQILRFFT